MIELAPFKSPPSLKFEEEIIIPEVTFKEEIIIPEVTSEEIHSFIYEVNKSGRLRSLKKEKIVPRQTDIVLNIVLEDHRPVKTDSTNVKKWSNIPPPPLPPVPPIHPSKAFFIEKKADRKKQEGIRRL